MTLFPPRAQFDRWFREAVGAPTPIQRAAWPVLRAGRHALLIAGTGQGKSLAAWRPIAETLVQAPSERRVIALHIAPLKALARDMLVNLGPLLAEVGRLRGAPLRAGLRCGDTPAAERRAQLRRPPEVLSTTPESLFVLLGTTGGRRMLRGVRTVVVDEVHAVAGQRRGSHLALSLERLDALCGRPVQRIGLSATAEPASMLAGWLGGRAEVAVVAPAPTGGEAPELVVERPGPPLGAWPGTAHWTAIHDRLAELAAMDGSLLVFCQTRAQVERTAAALGERLGADRVGAHHGSLDSACRSETEARFRDGALDVLVGSASLELGLDLGVVQRVAQLGSPGGLNALRQRAGRSRHRPGARSRLHWFPLTRHQLLELEAMQDALVAGRMDRLKPCPGHRDVLAQQLAAMVAFDGLDTVDALLERVRGAAPWCELDADDLRALGAALEQQDERLPDPQRAPRLRYDAGRDRFQAPPGLDRQVLANAGTIPEWFEYRVVERISGREVGRLDEEFAFESSPGQVIQLGHRAFRIDRVRCGRVDVTTSDDPASAELPFWFGEGAGRTQAVRTALLERIEQGARHGESVALLEESRAVLGALPARDRLVVERFLDPNGDRHLVLHTLAGARINRAWGLALRKRFCRQFNFELQAAATDDGVLISLGVTSEFEVAEVVRFVRSHNARAILIQALLDTPLFLTRFRWAANTALVLPRIDRAGPVPAQQQRSRTENLIACVFPDQLACLENLSGPREVPDHPLVRQALDDCLEDYMDVEGLIDLLGAIERSELKVHAVDLERPSPLAEALIHAPQHSYLDEAAAEERRTRSFEPVPGRNTDSGCRGQLGRTPAPWAAPLPAVPRTGTALADRPDALARLLATAGFLTAAEGERGVGLKRPVPPGGWSRQFATLVRERRAVALPGRRAGDALWVALDRLGDATAVWPGREPSPWLPESLRPAVRSPAAAAERRLRSRRRRMGLGWPGEAGG